MFNAAHPINAAENAFLNSLTGGPRRKSGSHRRPTSRTGEYYGTGPTSNVAAYERAVLAEQIQQAEAQLFSRHLDRLEMPVTPVIPPVEPPDPGVERAQLEREAGITDLQTRLAPFGTPPLAPAPQPVDVDAEAKSLFKQATQNISRLRLRARRELREKTRLVAEQQAQQETERRAAEHRRHQETLDAERSRLETLRKAMDERVRVWVAEQTAAREAAHAKALADAKAREHRLRANDPETVNRALNEALANERISIIGSAGGQAVIVLAIPELPDVIAEQEPAYTPAGRLTLHKRSKTQQNRLYVAALASELLRITRVAFAAAPGLTAVRCVVVRDSDLGNEPIYLGTLTRATSSSLQSRSNDPATLESLLEAAERVQINRQGRARDIVPLHFGADRELALAVRSVTSPAGTAASPDVVQQILSRVGSQESSPTSRAKTRNGAGRRRHRTSKSPRRAVAPGKTQLASETPVVSRDAERFLAILANDPDEDLRYEAINALRDRESAEYHDAFVGALDDSDQYVRRVAAGALRDLKDPRDSERFLAILANDPDEDLRYEAINALRDRESAEYHDAFVGALDDSDQYVRRVAAGALRDLKDPRDSERFLAILANDPRDSERFLAILANDPDEDLRYEAINALRDRESAEYHDAFVRALDDSDQYVRESAERALADLS